MGDQGVHEEADPARHRPPLPPGADDAYAGRQLRGRRDQQDVPDRRHRQALLGLAPPDRGRAQGAGARGAEGQARADHPGPRVRRARRPHRRGQPLAVRGGDRHARSPAAGADLQQRAVGGRARGPGPQRRPGHPGALRAQLGDPGRRVPHAPRPKRAPAAGGDGQLRARERRLPGGARGAQAALPALQRAEGLHPVDRRLALPGRPRQPRAAPDRGDQGAARRGGQVGDLHPQLPDPSLARPAGEGRGGGRQGLP